MDKVPEVQDEMNALVKSYESFMKEKVDEIKAYQSSVVTQAMSLEEKVRETYKFYAEHIESKARFTDDTLNDFFISESQLSHIFLFLECSRL